MRVSISKVLHFLSSIYRDHLYIQQVSNFIKSGTDRKLKLVAIVSLHREEKWLLTICIVVQDCVKLDEIKIYGDDGRE